MAAAILLTLDLEFEFKRDIDRTDNCQHLNK